MQRSIKFRAKTLKGEWVEFGLYEIGSVYHNDGVFYIHTPMGGIPCEMGTEKQYTGLKDKNGKEGYHKDIIKRSDKLYILEWHDNLAGWYLKPIHGGWHGATRSDFALMCEVIGNVMENPELLKDKIASE